MCTAPGDMLMLRFVDPFFWIWKCTSTISFPSATTLSWVEPPLVQNAFAPVMFRTMPVTLPEGALVAPSRMELPCSFVKFTLVPTVEGTL